MHNRSLDYAKTLRAWIAGIRANRAILETQFGAEVLRRYLRGYTLVVMGFEHNVLGLTRWSFLKRSSEDLLTSRSRLMRREAETTT
jgi:cyclopropane fatty-acyl-phospholipid synthase-like methyltransferase